MLETIMNECDELFKGKLFLSVEDVMGLLGCDEKTIYNWTKRSNPNRRPPRIIVGKELRFPKKPFLKWLVDDQCGV